jgi:hypothetical protein
MVPVNQGLHLQPSLDRLRVAVLEQNRAGSVEGLLAHHVLRDDPRIGVEWQVGCTKAWMDTEFRPTNLNNVAALGYFLWTHPTSKFTPQLLDGFGRMRKRDAFKGEHLSLARNPTRLLGIILGSLALGDAALETLSWCREVLEKMRQKRLIGFDPLVPHLYLPRCCRNERSTVSLGSVETAWSRHSQRIMLGRIAPDIFWPCRLMPQA